MIKTSKFYIVITLFLSSALLFNACQPKVPNPYANNAIATAHPLATSAGELMFKAGGNAFDAAVAAAFALAVVEPSMSGIGGRMQALYHTAAGDVMGIDATTVVPEQYKASEERFRYGYKTIGIPGVVAGLLQLHQKGGVLSLQKIMAPAIEYAEKGFKLLEGEAFRQGLVAKQLNEFEGTRQHFLNEAGRPYAAGDEFKQKDLAKVLRSIAANGRKGFYEGKVAEKIVADVQANGGILTLNDLKNYKVLSSRILRGTYKGYSIYGLYLPSFGATSIQLQQILGAFNLKAATAARWASTVGSSIAKAYAYRQYQKNKDSLKEILSPQRAKQWAKEIDPLKKKLAFKASDQPESWGLAQGHTTHLSVTDKLGNIVSLTQTVGPMMGSKVASPGLGFIYAVTLGGYLGDYQPGDRAASHISPLLFMKNKRPILVLGAAGGSRIPIAITQVAQRYLEQQINLDAALAAPRVYIDQDTLMLEKHPGLDWFTTAADKADLDLPHKWILGRGRFGRVHAVALDTLNMKWTAAADPDWEGTAVD